MGDPNLRGVPAPTSLIESKAALRARADAAMAASGRANLMDGAKPNFEPVLIDGRPGSKVVSWTLKSGETITQEELTRRMSGR
jgi:hypothetical protein